MRGMLIGLVLGLFLVACTKETDLAIGLAVKARQCQDFEIARQNVLISGNSLTKEAIDKAIDLNRLGTLLCATSMTDVTRQLQELAP